MIDLAAPITSWMPIVWYASFRSGMPSLCVGRWPPGIATERTWKLWAVVSTAEQDALLAALARPVPRRPDGALDFSSGPDAVLGPSRGGDPVLALYEPPAAGWPWITLGRWPAEIGRQVEAHREVYTWDADLTEAAALDRIAQGVGDGVMFVDLLRRPSAGTA